MRTSIIRLLIPLLPLAGGAVVIAGAGGPHARLSPLVASGSRPVAVTATRGAEQDGPDYGYAPHVASRSRAWGVLLRQEYRAALRARQRLEAHPSPIVSANAADILRSYGNMTAVTPPAQLAALRLPRSVSITPPPVPRE